MKQLAAILFLVAIVGAIWPRPLAFAGVTRRWQYLGLGFISLLLIGADGPRVDQPAKASVAAARSDTGTVEVGSMNWSKEGFGNVMVGSFSILNKTSTRVKDIKVRCVHTANSGTVIDSNTGVIYEIVEPRSQLWVHKFNMGFIHTQATSTNCRVIDYARA